MAPLQLTGPWLTVAAAASAHGLSDARLPWTHLAPYALVLAPSCVPGMLPLFAAASVCHFARDLGSLPRSLALHAALVAAVPLAGLSVASSLACLYYTAVHVPCHLKRTWSSTPRWLRAGMGCAAVALAAMCPSTIALTRRRQALVVAHVLVDGNSQRG